MDAKQQVDEAKGRDSYHDSKRAHIHWVGRKVLRDPHYHHLDLDTKV
jgi:hypothetical protein